MTNIAAIKVQGSDSQFGPNEPIVIVSDSMASNLDPQAMRKNDNVQKVVAVGDYILAGTGNAQVLRDISLRLLHRNEQSPFGTTENLADEIMRIASQVRLTDRTDIPATFIVGGKNVDGLQLYQVNITGFQGVGRQTIPMGERMERGYYFFVGSGSRFTTDHIEWSQRLGIPISLEDLTDAVTVAYNFANAGALDAAVNDKLQYAIITPSGVSTVYHPDIEMLNSELYQANVSRMMKRDTPKFTPDMSREDRERNSEIGRGYATLLRGVYHSLDRDLSDYLNWNRAFIQLSVRLADGKATLEDQQTYLAMRQGARQAVTEGVNAIVQRGFHELLAYRNRFLERENEAIGVANADH